MENLSLKQKYIIAGTVLLLAVAGFIFLQFKQKNDIVIDQGIQASETKDPAEQQASQTQQPQTVEDVKQEVPQQIIVDVSGQVANPGIVQLTEGARVNDAVEKAGGVAKFADVDQINLAKKLTDGEKIYVPKRGENPVSAAAQTNSAQTGSGQSSTVNINTASKEQLDSIPGVGPSTADKIIDYRNTKGTFKKIEDIKNVSGIGDKKYESIKKYITT